LIDSGNFLNPTAPISVFHLHDLGMRPVKVVGDEGYLPIELIEGVA
jgi:hypothetical protein